MVSLRVGLEFFRSNLKRILVIAPTVIALYAVAGFVIVPRVITAVVPQKVAGALDRPFSITGVRFNPFTFSLRLDGVRLGETGGGEFVSVAAIEANAELVSLLTLTPTLKFLSITAPVAVVVRHADGSFNFSDLLASAAGAPRGPADAARKTLPPLLVRRLTVTGARVQWNDKAVTPAFAATVTAFDLTMADLGTRKKDTTIFRMSLDTDLGTKVAADGEVRIAELSSRGHVEVSGVPLSRAAPYAAPFFKGRIDSGTAGLKFDYRYPSGGTGQVLPAVNQASFDLADFKVAPPDGGPPLVAITTLAVSGVNLEPAESFVGIGSVVLGPSRVNLARQKDGGIDLLDLVVPKKPSSPTAAASPAVDAGGWRLGLTAFTVSGLSAHIIDRAAEEPAALAVGPVDAGLSGFMLVLGRNAGMPTVEEASLTASDINLGAVGGKVPMVRIPRVAVKGARFVPAQRTIRIASISSEGGDIRITRDAAGRLDLLAALTPSQKASEQAGDLHPVPRPVEMPDSSGDAPATGDTPAVEVPWVVRLERFSVDGYKARLTDYSTAAAPSSVAVGDIAAGVSELSLTAGTLLPQVTDAHLALGDIRLSGAGETADTAMATVEYFEVTGASLEPESAVLTLGSVATTGGNITAVRNPDGSINLLNALLPKSPPTPDTAVKPQGPSPVDPFSALPFTVNLTRVVLSGYQAGFTDHSVREPAEARFKDVSLQIDSVTTARDGKGRIRLQVAGVRDGTLSAIGDVTVNPPSAALAVKAAGLSIIPGQPYFSEKIHALVTSGKFDTEGRLSVAPGDPVRLRYTGKAAVNKFSSVDQRNVKDLLKWETLYFSGIDVSLMPLKVRLDEVSLTDYYARVAVNADGSVNLRDVLAADSGGPPPSTVGAGDAPAPEPVHQRPRGTEKLAAAPDIRVAKVTLQGGRVDFSDNSLQPTFETKMLDLGGTISGLSSESLARADVFLAGRLENQSPLTITGQINPLIEDQYTDIQIEFSDIELSPFSPYAGKYIGRQLDKGKLTLVLGYKISGRKLAGENKVYLDQFTLGESVESPDAINLPLDLAVALLKDPSGRIQLDLPVRGDLEDPDFSIAGVVVQLLLNTITKIATAPFAVLGGMFGGGPELSYVDFDAGSSVLSTGASEKLQKLVEALAARPALSIEVQGQVKPETDGLSLREARLKKLVQAEKLRDLLKKNPSTPPAAADTVSPAEFAVYIRRVYDKTDMAKPRNPDGSLKALPPEEMEKLVFTNIDITAADLRRLAMQRAEAAKDFLLADERIESGRVYLREPDLTPEKDLDGKPVEQFGRVNFAIRK